MTLRARLTASFLVVALGPGLVAAGVVAGTLTAAAKQRDRDRLAAAAATVRTAVAATCDRMRAVAELAAARALTGTPPATQVVADQGVGGGIRIESPTGVTLAQSRGAPGAPWALCDRPGGAAQDPGTAFQALAAAAPVRDAAGHTVAYAYAAQPLDMAYVRQVAGSAGVDVTLLSDPTRSTGRTAVAAELARYAGGIGDATPAEYAGSYLLRVDLVPGEPLAFVLSVPVPSPRGPVLAVCAALLVVALAAAVPASALARRVTRPLRDIAVAADRAAQGDLSVRVPVRHDDEVGRLGVAFNRMTRQTYRYVEALTASRDQLRGNLERLGVTLSAGHDLPRILRVTLASAVCATGAQAGMVLLTGEDGELRFHCGEGFDAATAAGLVSLTVAPGAGVLGATAASAAASRGRTSGPGPDGGTPALPTGEPACRTYLVAPLRVPARTAARPGAPDARPAGTVYGVLALYDRIGGGDFDDADLRTVQAFAGHAAVALDNVRLHEEARRLSHTDALTGLYNYRHLKDLLRREVNRAARFGHPLCAVTIDLDRFKDVNDTYGHAAGDSVLVEFARRVGMEIRGVDFAFRVGGEEFVLLLPETDAPGGVTLARRLGTAVRGTPFTVSAGLRAAGGGRDVRSGGGAGPARRGAGGDRRPGAAVGITVTASVGVAVYPEHATTGSALLRAADEALYAAKAAGRDTYRLAAAAAGRSAASPAAGASGGASGGTHPPRQSRGR